MLSVVPLPKVILALQVKADPRLKVPPPEKVVALPGTDTPLVEMVFVPAPTKRKVKVAPEKAVVPAVQVTLPFTSMLGDVPVANVTVPAETVQSKQFSAPVRVTV